MVAIVPRYFWPRGSSWVIHSKVNTNTSVIIRENLYYTRIITCYRKISISIRKGQITCGWILRYYEIRNKHNLISRYWFQENLCWYYFSFIFKCKFQFKLSKNLKKIFLRHTWYIADRKRSATPTRYPDSVRWETVC